ncbi:contactin-4-like [Cyprinodon tularosa]|uniref:contactin-4-like n=1 Tax=Cyprinodon tularosa TaxID=77115 RepID=UPI0018E1FE9B|nr:contactin-4-like [Cyprinodon tularosa]
MKVSCLSEKGDSPQYSWTLDGHTLTDSEIFSRNNVNNIIILRSTISGLLACLVRNQISQSFKQMSLFNCGVKPSCDGRKDGAQCFGALGSKVDLTLVDSPSNIPGFQLKKNNSVILIWRNNNIIFSIEKSRFFFFPRNGTLRIHVLGRTDSGQYKLDMFDKYGKETGFRTLQLFVQAPVISAQLVPECWFQGKMKVSCLSEGDSPHYSWTLDGHTLPDSELLSGNNENNIIILRQNISGILACSVRNQISHSFKQINLSGCGVKMICDGRQDGAQCYEAFGSKVDIQLVENVSTIPRFHWTKDQSVILRWINNNILFRAKESKVLFFPNNGTVRIKNLSRTDSGQYKLEMFDKGGRQIGQRTLQFYVQAPVSSVQLVLKCLSQGQRNVSCLCEGDSPQYSWMLDGYPLTDSEIFSRNNESNIIILGGNISGNLACFVKNQISSSFNQINISGCGLSTLLVLGLRATVVILPVIGVSQYFTWRRKKIEKAKESAFSQITEDPESSALMIEMKSFEQ